MRTVAILSCVYNGESYLRPYFESLLAQSIHDFQLIIVDDGSTDATPDIINEYTTILLNKGADCLCLRNNGRKGQAFCYSRGLKCINSEYFLWLDADDLLTPDSLEKRVSFMRANPSLDLCICDAYEAQYPNYDKIVRIVEKPHKENDYFEDVLRMRDVLWVPGSIFVKTSFLWERIPNKEIFDNGIAQNIQLMLPLLYKANYLYMGIPLYTIVARRDSDSRRNRGYQDQALRIAKHYLTTMVTLAGIERIPPLELAHYSELVFNAYLASEARCSLAFQDRPAADYFYSRMGKPYRKEVSLPNFKNRFVSRTKAIVRRLFGKTNPQRS